MIHDKIPEITEEFTMTVERADGGKETHNYVPGNNPSGQIIAMKCEQPAKVVEFEKKLDGLAREVLNGRRTDQT